MLARKEIKGKAEKRGETHTHTMLVCSLNGQAVARAILNKKTRPYILYTHTPVAPVRRDHDRGYYSRTPRGPSGTGLRLTLTLTLDRRTAPPRIIPPRTPLYRPAPRHAASHHTVPHPAVPHHTAQYHAAHARIVQQGSHHCCAAGSLGKIRYDCYLTLSVAFVASKDAA